MKYIPIFLLFTVITACGTVKEPLPCEVVIDEGDTIEDPSDNFIHIELSHYTPYCGGMAPTPQMLENQTQLQRNTSFYLINLKDNSKEKVKTDSMGVLHLNLEKGKFAIQETYKNVSYEAFYKQYYQEPSKYFQETGGEDCYKKWWESKLISFEITSYDSTYTYKAQSRDRCFTGNNPCRVYTGPPPP